MPIADAATGLVERAAADFYTDVLARLTGGGVPFLVGGAFAYARYSGIDRETKDLDIFIESREVSRVFALLEDAGYETELTFPHWLGKVRHDARFIDVIFGSGNGLGPVDHEWFEHAVHERVLEVRVRLCAPEEMIWSKAFIQERERFDGADVLHLLRALAPTLAWDRLMKRFGEHWRVLLSHLVLFGFVYPDRRDAIPAWVSQELMRRFVNECPEPSKRVCYGTLLSRAQYRFDLEQLGYCDPRLEPGGHMTREEIDTWTAAIADQRDD